ncbi:MAG: hypothetical protein H7Y60_02635 [Rhodospirillaceae bacterium]|nr:hypothetical protein [Rhodospirillales bacterium]
MLKRFAFVVSCILVAAPAVAGEAARPRLVAGGMDLSQPELRTELFTKGAFSAGAVADSTPTEHGRERMALGGYAAYAFRDLKFSSSLKGDSVASSADFSASYLGGVMGVDGIASAKLGYQWGKQQAFSVNPAQAGLSAFSGSYDPSRPVGDLSLTLSFTHDVTPSLSLGGFAAATRKDDDREPESGLRFGAGVGYKF